MTLFADFVLLSNFVMRSFVSIKALMISLAMRTSLKVIKLFSCSTQISMKFQLLIKNKIIKKTIHVLAFKLLDVVFIMLINAKMPTLVGIFTFVSMIIYMYMLI